MKITPLLFVKERAPMERFYREAFGLGLDEAASQPGYVVLATAASTRLALHEVPPAVAERIVVADPAEPRSETALKLVFSVDDIVTATAAVERLGGRRLGPPADDGAVDVVDPEGNVLRIEP